MELVELHRHSAPICPNDGITGAPIHPAHAAARALNDRIYDATPHPDEDAADFVPDPVMEGISLAANDPPMRLFVGTLSPQRPPSDDRYLQVAYLQCLTCGLVLPVQSIHRPDYPR